MRDYLSAYLDGENSNTYAPQVTDNTDKTPKRGSSVSFVSTKRVEYPENSRGEDAPVLADTPAKETHTCELTKPTKRRTQESREPHYLSCVEATRDSDGSINRAAADGFYVALSLKGGHAPDDVTEMLRRISPASSDGADYCAAVIEQVQKNPSAYSPPELIEKYLALHPFAWELNLEIQIIEGVQ